MVKEEVWCVMGLEFEEFPSPYGTRQGRVRGLLCYLTQKCQLVSSLCTLLVGPNGYTRWLFLRLVEDTSSIIVIGNWTYSQHVILSLACFSSCPFCSWPTVQKLTITLVHMGGWVWNLSVLVLRVTLLMLLCFRQFHLRSGSLWHSSRSKCLTPLLSFLLRTWAHLLRFAFAYLNQHDLNTLNLNFARRCWMKEYHLTSSLSSNSLLCLWPGKLKTHYCQHKFARLTPYVAFQHPFNSIYPFFGNVKGNNLLMNSSPNTSWKSLIRMTMKLIMPSHVPTLIGKLQAALQIGREG